MTKGGSTSRDRWRRWDPRLESRLRDEVLGRPDFHLRRKPLATGEKSWAPACRGPRKIAIPRHGVRHSRADFTKQIPPETPDQGLRLKLRIHPWRHDRMAAACRRRRGRVFVLGTKQRGFPSTPRIRQDSVYRTWLLVKFSSLPTRTTMSVQKPFEARPVFSHCVTKAVCRCFRTRRYRQMAGPVRLPEPG